MKTLDEVIEKCQENVDLVNRGEWEVDCFLSHEYMVDALHYLRELQLFRETPVMQGIHKAQEEYATYPVEDWNPALTWDELKIMEGKPVWIEEKYSFSKEWHGGWEVICTVWDNEFDDDPYLSMTDEECRHKDDMGERWQAYRKERNEVPQQKN